MKKILTIITTIGLTLLVVALISVSICLYISIKENKEHKETETTVVYNEYRQTEKQPNKPSCEKKTETKYETKYEPSCEKKSEPSCECRYEKELPKNQEFELHFKEQCFSVDVKMIFDTSIEYHIETASGVMKGTPYNAYGYTTYLHLYFKADTKDAEYFSYKICDTNGRVVDMGTVFIENSNEHDIVELLPINRNTNYTVYVFGGE